jgi:cytochrome b561
MSFVTTQPEALTSATGTLKRIGSSMSAQDAAAAAIHEMLVNTLGISAGSHAAAEAANAIATS